MIDPALSHLYNRAAFGLSPKTGSLEFEKNSFSRLAQEASDEKPLRIVGKPDVDLLEMKKEEGKAKELKKKLREDQVRLTVAWFSQLSDPTIALREKMTLFWHDHFACRTKNPYLAQQQNNILRNYALGKFGDLLMAVSKDPAMLQFLNNQQNRKDSPNENFAREVMELFTLGRGHYTEEDIKSAARAFTGWGFQPRTGDFIFRLRVHDDGAKSFRGKSGNFSGEDIIHMILEDRQTARFIAAKVWRYFVHEELTDEDTLHNLAEDFYHSDYDILALLSGIFKSSWFFDGRYQGNRIKSPVEMLAGIQVQTGGTFVNPANIIFLQKALGQVLFLPPNVGGWPQGKEWIDSSSLTFRMSLPTILLRNSETEFQGKDDGDANDVTNDFKKAGKISFAVDWAALGNSFIKKTETETVERVESYLLPRPTSSTNRKMIKDFAGGDLKEPEYLRKLFTGFMSLPEYQLS